jgi:hypothetical protein
MADAKISALPAATLPLAGTEVLPIVQGGTTDKVAVDDLTVKNIRSNATTGILQVTGPGAGTTRVMTVPNANFTAARTDAAQTFTGDQSFTGRVTSNVADGDPAQIANATNGHVRIIPYLDGVSYSTIIAYAAGYSGFGPLTLECLNLRLSTTGTARLTIANTGDVTAETGNLKFATNGKGLEFTGNGGVLWRSGAGTPEGAVTAPVGSLYTRTDGGLLSTLYVKESGTGNTGWVAK